MNVKHAIGLLLAGLWMGLPAYAKDKAHDQKATQQDVARHRALAVAHESAARCLEVGKGHEQCQKELQVACKGLAIGKYCGMKHEH